MAWKLMVSVSGLALRSLFHPVARDTAAEAVEALLGHSQFGHMPPLVKAVLVARAEHDPSSWSLDAPTRFDPTRRYWLEEER